MAYSKADEMRALAEIAKARRRVVQEMFTGTKLCFGSPSKKTTAELLNTGRTLYNNSKALVKGTGEATKAASGPAIQTAVEGFIKTCADVDNIQELAAAISSEALKNLIAEATPVIGVLVSGGKLALATKAVVEDGRNLYKFDDYRSGFLTGDAQKAADAVKFIIQRDLALHSVDLARNAAVTGAKIAGCFADFGTVTNAGIGIANALAELGLRLAKLGVEIKHMRAGNKRLATPATLDLTVFEDCPILGCYLLTCADTSSVANFFIADIGLPGWMDKVEKMKREQMDPLLRIATKDITTSSLVLEGLASNKGTFAEPGFFAKKKAAALRFIKGRA